VSRARGCSCLDGDRCFEAFFLIEQDLAQKRADVEDVVCSEDCRQFLGRIA
jgi:hypothetical protein